MFERVISFLRELPGSSNPVAGVADDPRIAAAALMYHVMDADGVRQDAEWERIKELLTELYGLASEQLETLITAGQQAESEAVDLYAFTSVITRHLEEADRVRFIRVLWDVVYADGEIHELEDNMLWRVAELIGVDRRDRIAMRQEAARRAPQAHGASSDE